MLNEGPISSPRSSPFLGHEQADLPRPVDPGLALQSGRTCQKVAGWGSRPRPPSGVPGPAGGERRTRSFRTRQSELEPRLHTWLGTHRPLGLSFFICRTGLTRTLGGAWGRSMWAQTEPPAGRASASTCEQWPLQAADGWRWGQATAQPRPGPRAMT